jgi:glutamate synthase (NADPH/NADH) large chain
MLGAEEFGIGTASLIAMGCIMVRQCHSNTCPVGVCTQDEALRSKFAGSPEKVIALFTFIAEEVREILASLGVKSLQEIVGRTDLLMQVSRGGEHLDDLDLNPLLVKADPGRNAPYCTVAGRTEVPDTLDAQIVRDAAPFLERGEKMQLTYTVANVQRAIGTRVSSHIVRKFGMAGLAPGHLTVQLKGSAGQSLGAFAVQGLRLELSGEANDYVGKGLSGATLVIRPSPHLTGADALIGNTVLYGATSGTLFAAGLAGERFAVRNSGAVAVVEGLGANGCEYMTGGTVVVLGPVGFNFAAGMTGGMAFVHDPEDRFASAVNRDSVVVGRLASAYWAGVLKALVEDHARETGSPHAHGLLRDWDRALGDFWQVCPKEMLARLDQPLEAEETVHLRA